MTDIELTEADVSEALAQHTHADLVEQVGAKAALKLFNRQVSHWAAQFGDFRLRRVAYTVGSLTNGATHSTAEYRVTLVKIQRRYRRHYGVPISERALIRHLETLETAEIFEVTRAKQDYHDPHPGMNKANVYLVHFSRVLPEPHQPWVFHDFATVPKRIRKPSSGSKRAGKHAGKNASKRAGEVGSISNGSTVPVRSNDPSAVYDDSPGAKPPTGTAPLSAWNRCRHVDNSHGRFARTMKCDPDCPAYGLDDPPPGERPPAGKPPRGGKKHDTMPLEFYVRPEQDFHGTHYSDGWNKPTSEPDYVPAPGDEIVALTKAEALAWFKMDTPGRMRYMAKKRMELVLR